MVVRLLVSLVSFFTLSVRASAPDTFTQKSVTYKSFFGECPAKSSGELVIVIMKEFEKKHSLKDVKEKMLAEKLDEKYFLSDYRISFNPLIRTLRINLQCPEPLAKVQVYKNNGEEHYSAILGENAKLYEPGYENLMKAEKKLGHNLPLLALSLDKLDGDTPVALAHFIKQMEVELRRQIAEIIINKNNELTIVFALGSRATSVFIGADLWEEKLGKLNKIVGYINKSKRYPSSINLVNAKKVVVKFSDNI